MDKKQMFDFEKLAQDLRTSTKRIRFTKRDGTIRDLKATLQESLLPARVGEATARAHNPAVMSVWDVDNKGWRSFRRDSVIEILD